MQVLLVETDPAGDAAVRAACERGGYRLVLCRDPREAADPTGAGFDLVIASATAPLRVRRAVAERCGLSAASLLYVVDSPADLDGLTAPEQRAVTDFVVRPPDEPTLAARLELIRRQRESRGRERALLRAIPDLLFRMRRDGTYLDYQPPGAVGLYTHPEVFLGRTVREVLPSEVAEACMDAIDAALTNGKATVDYELLLDGQPQQYEARLVKIGADELLAFVRDVTEERRTARALARSERTVQAIFDAMPDTIYRCTSDGLLVDYIPRSISPVSAHRDQVLGKNKEDILALVPALDRNLTDRVEAAMRDAIDTGELRTLRYSFDYEGSHFVREARLVPCGDGEILAIDRDITDIVRAEEELRAAARVKQAFASRVVEVQEAERQHLARELHDVIGQRLLVHRMDAEWIAKRGDRLREPSLELCAALDETLHLVRNLAQGLRPPALDDLGIGSALETLVSETGDRFGVRCEAEIAPDAADVSCPIAVALYRIAQEALSNAVRHAECRRIQLRLQRANAAVELQIHDDGKGISPSQIHDPRSLGLLGMRERAELLGGRVRIEAAEAGGTEVIAEIPHLPLATAEEPR